MDRHRRPRPAPRGRQPAARARRVAAARRVPTRRGVTVNRHLDWDGCFNARDLGGLRTVDGRTTRRGRVVRADRLDRLTTAGWSALQAYGIRTIVDLLNDEEIQPDVLRRPAGVTTVRVPLDDVADTDFWEYCWANRLDGTPLYYELFLERKPDRCAAAVAAIARADPDGGVVFHCGGGRDRTGLIALLLLALVGVGPDDVIVDYELSNARLPPFWEGRGMADQRPIIEEILASRNTSARALLLKLLGTLDADAYLRAAGLSDNDLSAVHTRLLRSARSGG